MSDDKRGRSNQTRACVHASYLGQEHENEGLAEVPVDAHDRERHPREVAVRVPDEDACWVP